MVNATQRARYDLYLFQVLYNGANPNINGAEYAKLVKDEYEGGLCCLSNNSELDWCDSGYDGCCHDRGCS